MAFGAEQLREQPRQPVPPRVQPVPAAPTPVVEHAFLRSPERAGETKPDEHRVRDVAEAAKTMQTQEIAKRFYQAFDKQRGTGANVEGAGFQNALTFHYFSLLKQRALQPKELMGQMERLKVDVQREMVAIPDWQKKYASRDADVLKKQLDISFAGVQNALFTILDLYRTQAGLKSKRAVLGINDTLDAAHMIDLIKIEPSAADAKENVVTFYQIKGMNDTTPDQKIIGAHIGYVNRLVSEHTREAFEAERGYETWERNTAGAKGAVAVMREFWNRLGVDGVRSAAQLVKYLNNPVGISKAELHRKLRVDGNLRALSWVAVRSEYAELQSSASNEEFTALVDGETETLTAQLKAWAKETTLSHDDLIKLPHVKDEGKNYLVQSEHVRYESVLAQVDRHAARVNYRSLKQTI